MTPRKIMYVNPNLKQLPELLSFAAAIAACARKYGEINSNPYRAISMALGEGLGDRDWRIGRMIARAVLRGRFHLDHGLCMRSQELDYGQKSGRATEEFENSALLREYFDLSLGKLGGQGIVVAHGEGGNDDTE